MGGFNRKAEAGLVIVLVIIVVLFFFGWLINVSQRECKTNRECGSESYCGSDFACHQYPTIQKTVIEYNFFWPAVILGIAIVAAVWIFRQPKQETRIVEQNVEQRAEAKEPEEVSDLSEPYYKSDSNLRTP
jgi:Na+/melibiose symporter-like transporter